MPSISHSGLNSYLMRMTETIYRSLLNCCVSVLCLFDGYLITTLLKAESHAINHCISGTYLFDEHLMVTNGVFLNFNLK